MKMKNLLIAVMALASVSTFAVDQSQSWEEIRSEVNSNPKLIMVGSTAFLGKTIAVLDTCIEGENLKSTVPYAKYERVYVGRTRDTNDSERDGYATVKTGMEILEFPITYASSFRKCANNGKRCTWVETMVSSDLVKQISVKKLVRTRNNSNSHSNSKVYKTLFTKIFEIPACN
jgi:hypothetical protein